MWLECEASNDSAVCTVLRMCLMCRDVEFPASIVMVWSETATFLFRPTLAAHLDIIQLFRRLSPGPSNAGKRI